MKSKKQDQRTGDRTPSGFRLLHTLRGHEGEIRRIAWSQDGRRLASPSSDMTIRLWDTETGTLLRTLEGFSGTVYCVAWSPDGKTLASGGQADTVKLWNVETGRPLPKLDNKHTGWVNSVAWSPDGKVLASCSFDTTVLLWDGKTGEFLRKITEHRGIVHNLAWSPDSQFLASAAMDRTVQLWDIQNESKYRTLDHAACVFCLAWSPDGQSLATGSWDHTIRHWNVATGRETNILEGHTSRLASVSFSSNGLFLASKGSENIVRLWRCDDWKTVAFLDEETSGRNSPSLAFHPNLPVLATLGERDCAIRIWQLVDDELLRAAPERETHHYRNAKVVLIGDTGVGKSGLAMVLTNEQFRPTESTHGRNIYILDKNEVALPQGQQETRETLLWDTAGQPGYRPIHQLHLNEVTVAVVVFDARSEIDPFAGVRYWVRALQQAWRLRSDPAVPLKMYLVAARADRGSIPVSRKRIDSTVQELGFDDFFETSAREGWGISDLADAIREGIDWNVLPKVTSTELFKAIKQFLVIEQKAGRLLSTANDLYRSFCEIYPNLSVADGLQAKFITCIRLMENHRLIRRMSFGGLILLQHEQLDAYASAMINAAKAEPDGLGFIAEEDILRARFPMPKDARVKDEDQERLLLIATVEELLRHEIALKETTDVGTDLVFPSQFTRERPDAPNVPGKAVVFNFEGPVPSIYATLAVRLSRSHLFNKKEMWKSAVTFEATVGGVCGIYLRVADEGNGELTLFFDDEALEPTRFQFEDYVSAHFQRHALPGAIRRRRIAVCSECDEPITDSMVKRRRERGFTSLDCPVCGAKISLLDREERLAAINSASVADMDRAADARRDIETATAILRGKIESEDFDVFLCHNSLDKVAVRQIGERLKEQGILPWLDEWNLVPGRPWQYVLESTIEKIKSAAVFVGEEGVGPWQKEEIYAFLDQFVARSCPVIPVLLAGIPEKSELPIFLRNRTELPIFLRNRTWVDFRKYNPDPMKQLIWGITGERRPLPAK